MTVLPRVSLLQSFNTREPFPSLSQVMPNPPLARLKNFQLPCLADDIVLLSLDCGVEMEVQVKDNVLDGEDCVPR